MAKIKKADVQAFDAEFNPMQIEDLMDPLELLIDKLMDGQPADARDVALLDRIADVLDGVIH